MRSLPAAAITAASILAASSVLAGPIERTRMVETDTAQAALDREAARAVAENDRAFREAEETARRQGVDITAYRAARDDLHHKRQEALRQNNRLRARMFEALSMSNTGNMLEAILVHMPPGPEQQRYKQRAQEARASVEAFKTSLAPSGR